MKDEGAMRTGDVAGDRDRSPFGGIVDPVDRKMTI
jgi:hypothetical protein